MPRTLKNLHTRHVTMFKIKNRRGYAAICMRNLTEGRTPSQAFARMAKAVKRAGYALTGTIPKPR